MAVVKTCKLRVEVGAADELYIGIIRRGFQHERLVTVGVADDDFATALGKLDAGVGAAIVLADVGDDFPLKSDALGSHFLGDGILCAIEIVSIALVIFVADADHADFQSFACNRLGGFRIAGLRPGGLGVVADIGRLLFFLSAADKERRDHCKRKNKC